MESTTDFDLEELESRLYSQVFHSTENWDKQSATNIADVNNLQTRHVSPYAVSNVPISGNRYWDTKSNPNPQDKIQNIDQSRTNSNYNTLQEHFSNESTNTESAPVQSISCQQNYSNSFPALESIIPLEITTNHENQAKKPLMYKHYLIPPTFQLPKSKAKKMPRRIIKYFNLKGKESFRSFRSFLYYVEKLQINNNTSNNTKIDPSKINAADQSIMDIKRFSPIITITTNGIDRSIQLDDIPLSADQSIIDSKQISPNITITTNGIDRSIQLDDIPLSVINDSALPKKEELENNDIITLSDSDSDSVIEVPLPPLPVYNVDSSSESEIEETEIISYKIPFSPKNKRTKGNKAKYVNPAAKVQQNLAKEVNINQINDNNTEAEDHFNDNSTEHSLQDCEIQLENINKNNPVDLNVSFTELEKERDDFLHTPDTNDFLENDVSSLSKNNLIFNFGLHSSDLDLTKDKEEPIKTVPSTHDHDLYETESSCSEMGSVISKTRPVFNEINFESPIKDIFCEPDLSKFSNFITPNRNMPSVKQSKIRSNTLFAPIQTKARGKKVNEEETITENKRRSRSDSSEYHSDATTLRIKKKNKKARKKAKRKEKLENKNIASAVVPSPSEEFQSMELSKDPELIFVSSTQSPIENTISQFGPGSNTIINLENKNSDTNKIPITPKDSKHENSTPPLSTKLMFSRCSIDSEYYADTYFADDFIVLDELSKQDENTENNIETSSKEENDIESSSANIATINNEVTCMNEFIPINKETTVKLSNNVESLNPETSKNGANFSFVNTWQKTTEENKNVNEAEDLTTPSKKMKTNYSTVHPYVVTIESSDEDSEISVGKNEENISQTVTIVDVDENSCPDLVVVNVKNDKTNVKPANKKSLVANPFSFVNTYLQNKEKKSFRDFWTTDLKQFYDESWGQENFDIEVAQSSMSEDASNWKIIPTDLFKQRLPRRKGPYCKRCRDWGHTQFSCSQFRGPICSTCGSFGHWYSRCPQSFCTTCRNPSIHYTTKCRNCAHYGTVQCNLCYNVGHEMKYCPDLWRRYHLTTESHTELKTSASVLKSPTDRWCSNCAKQGHCEDKCTYLRHEHFPTTPGIISYVPTYDDVFKLPLLPPPPNIPIFKDANVTIADLRTIRNDVINSSNKKYMNILKQLRQRCNKYDFQLINQIDRLRRNNMNNQVFSKKQIQEIHRIRARVTRDHF